jgi:hypothetical protein
MVWSLLTLAAFQLAVAGSHLVIAWRAKRFGFRDLAVAVGLAPGGASLVYATQFATHTRADVGSLESAAINAGIILTALSAIALAYRGPRFVESEAARAAFEEAFREALAEAPQIAALERRLAELEGRIRA